MRVSEAQSAVVNDSPVDCQSRRPGSPQRAVTVGDWGRETRKLLISSVILSGGQRPESKDLRTKFTNAVNELRRFLHAAAPWSE